jgi:hypothetical protein
VRKRHKQLSALHNTLFSSDLLLLERVIARRTVLYGLGVGAAVCHHHVKIDCHAYANSETRATCITDQSQSAAWGPKGHTWGLIHIWQLAKQLLCSFSPPSRRCNEGTTLYNSDTVSPRCRRAPRARNNHTVEGRKEQKLGETTAGRHRSEACRCHCNAMLLACSLRCNADHLARADGCIIGMVRRPSRCHLG